MPNLSLLIGFIALTAANLLEMNRIAGSTGTVLKQRTHEACADAPSDKSGKVNNKWPAAQQGPDQHSSVQKLASTLKGGTASGMYTGFSALAPVLSRGVTNAS